MFTIDHVSMIVKSDEYIKLGFAVENNTLYNLGWNDFTGYEFLSPSINPAQHKR